MALLTADDVLNKKFQATKFREGYDQDEVDDFLDEIVIELRRLGQENGELRQRLSAADARVAELQRAVGSAPAAAAPVPTPAPVAEPTAPPLGLDDLAQNLAKKGIVDLLDGGPRADPKPTLAAGAPAIHVTQQRLALLDQFNAPSCQGGFCAGHQAATHSQPQRSHAACTKYCRRSRAA